MKIKLDFLNNNDPEKMIQSGFALINSGDIEKAQTHFKQAVKKFPDNARLAFLNGFASMPESSLQEAPGSRIPAFSESEFSRALQIHVQGSSLLEDLELSLSHKFCFQFALQQQDLQKAQIIFIQFMKNFPAEAGLLAGRLVVALDQSHAQPADMEYWARLALDQTPDDVDLRKIWKKARKARGLSFYSDRPETEKKQIYKDHAEIKNEAFFEILGQQQGRRRRVDIQSLGDLQGEIVSTSKNSEEAAHKSVMQKYAITAFELSLIEQEGKTEGWSIGNASLASSAGKIGAGRIEMRDQMHCVYCNKRFPAPYWPRHGNMVGFYAESAERVKVEPGVYRLPLKCPFCNKTWYMVWDSDPGDAIGSHILRHFERLIEINPAFQEFLHGLVVDRVLGGVVDFLEDCIREAHGGNRQIRNTFFEENDTIHLVTYSPHASLIKTREVIGNYTQYLLQSIPSEKKSDLISKYNYVNWIYCLSLGEDTSNFQMTILPSFDSQQNLPIVYPVEMQDKNAFDEMIDWMASKAPPRINMTIKNPDISIIRDQISRIIQGLGLREVDQEVSTGFVVIAAAASRRLVTIKCSPLDDKFSSVEVFRDENIQIASVLLTLLKYVVTQH